MKELARRARREARFLRSVARHPRTPRLSRWLLLAALGYLASPLDLIPDCIPVIGHLDDALIVPGLVLAALRLVPEDVLADARAGTGEEGTE